VIEIVGGGLIGLSCAWELQHRGLKVVVYERDLSRHQSASWAGAGMLGALQETFPDGIWQARALESARMYPEWVKRIGGDIDFVASGEDADGHVDPRDLLRELTGQVRVVERSVGALSELEGEQIVVCAGAWGLPGMPQVEPVKGYLIGWDGLPAGSIEGILREGHTYVFQRRRGRVIAGSTEQRIGFDERVEDSLVADLKARAEAVAPILRGRAVAEVWSGFRPACGGDVPLVERLNERVIAAYGHYRNGILLAPWTARWVAGEVQGRG
jgi:glycine/D-amino acid oxidase-like deaminating enzyme